MTDWVSGDYSAATDNLKIQYTKGAFESSLLRSSRKGALSPMDQDLLRDVLYEQTLVYRKKVPDGKFGYQIEQTHAVQATGQLMGSTLSFPILCTVNLCCYWAAMEEFLKKELQPRDLPVLVNGDDILFRSSPRFYKIWLKWIEEVGFELSVGKNYVHPRFFTVNSVLHAWDHGKPRLIPYLNAGLLTGVSKLSGREAQRTVPIWDFYNAVVPMASDPVRAHKRFLHYHRDNVKAFTQDGEYSLFLDPKFGGLGFQLPAALRSSIKFTGFQRKFGTFLRGLALQPFDGQFSELKPFRGIVVAKRPSAVQRRKYHYSHFLAHRPFWPLNFDEREVLRTEAALRNAQMTSTLVDPDRPVVEIRRPDRQVLRDFRLSDQKCAKLHDLLQDEIVYVEKAPWLSSPEYLRGLHLSDEVIKVMTAAAIEPTTV